MSKPNLIEAILQRSALLRFALSIVAALGVAGSHAQCPFLVSGLTTARATTDGLLFIRAAQALTASPLTAATGTTLTGADIQSAISSSLAQIDLNDSGRFDLFDASMIIRYLLGFRGDGLVAGSAGAGAQRQTGEAVQSYIDGGCVPTRYSVGGTISGLTADGLALVINANSSETLLVPANATGFTMPVLLQSGVGNTYDVQIRMQPTGQRCTVTSGSGTIGSANVNNVVVTCANTYTISGSVEYLRGAAGMILLNRGETLPIPVNATSFVMTTSFVTGSEYSVTIFSQPLGRRCTVVDGSGVVGSTNVTNVRINCCNPATPPGTISQRLGSGAFSNVGYSGVCDANCPAACAAFNFDCCSESLLYSGVCTNDGVAGVATCQCRCE
jgi:hypothetical protein